MNLNDMKISGTENVSVTDSLALPILKLKVGRTGTASTPSNNDFIIYVDKSLLLTSECKTYTFTLTNPLKYFDGVSDEFHLEPVIENNKIKMKPYILRKVNETEVLSEYIKEELDYQSISLFEGANYVYTNYTDATIDMIYPKNDDLVLYFLNVVLFQEWNKNVLTLDDIYFKDAFTKVVAGINVDANNLNVNCITSKNNTFSLDSDGNLVVNSITAQNSSTIDFDTIYPVGSVYLSVNNTNPSTYFGGTWEQIAQGKTLVGVDLSDSDFNESRKTGGEKRHTLSISEMPNHTHSLYSENDAGPYTSYNGNRLPVLGDTNKTWTYVIPINYTGGNQSHNNLQPYFTCYIWTRVQ